MHWLPSSVVLYSQYCLYSLHNFSQPSLPERRTQSPTNRVCSLFWCFSTGYRATWANGLAIKNTWTASSATTDPKFLLSTKYMSVLNVSIWHYLYLLQASLNFVAKFFFMWNKLPLLQITPKVNKYNHKLQWQKARQRLHTFGNKCTFFSLIPTLEKKIS